MGVGASRLGRVLLVSVACLAVTTTLLLAREVASQPHDSKPLLERVRELEQRVQALETRLATLERETVGRATSLDNIKSFPVAPAAAASGPCDPAFVVDLQGTRLLKAGCEAHDGGSRCNPLWVVDARGVKTVRQGCEKMLAGDCADPYRLDEAGQRQPRPECLDVGY